MTIESLIMNLAKNLQQKMPESKLQNLMIKADNDILNRTAYIVKNCKKEVAFWVVLNVLNHTFFLMCTEGKNYTEMYLEFSKYFK